MRDFQLEPGSFRDRTSRVFYVSGHIYRGLSSQAAEDWAALSATRFFRRYVSDGRIVPTEAVDTPDGLDVTQAGNWSAFLKHQAIPFVSYPYEWCFGMLKDAALLQIDLLLAALNENMTLKDASAFNFQWMGSKPVFIDIPSFERLKPGEPWAGYRQFCQLFLYPLMLQAYKDLPFQPWLRGCIDGIEPEQCRNLMSAGDLLRPGVLVDVYLHAKAHSDYADTRRDIKSEMRSAGFNKDLIVANVTRLKKVVGGLHWKRGKTEWSDYASVHSYTDQDYETKAEFVRKVVQSQHRHLVWDLGCNVGSFSKIAAENADNVVSIDADHLSIERLYQELKSKNDTKILPLIGNVADPSPDLGWRGLERRSLFKRGNPDLILCLALIHHMVISANVPLKEFVDWLAGLGGDLIIEFVTRQDPMVQTLLRNKVDNYADYDKEFFERCLQQAFDVAQQEMLKSGTRILYYAHARSEKGSRERGL
jgi:SAM-dependent methyltransferase